MLLLMKMQSLKASATDLPVDTQWADYQWTPVDRLIDYIDYLSRVTHMHAPVDGY